MWRSLVLTVDPAVPPISGAELRNWQNAKALSDFGQVRLVSFRPMHWPAQLSGDRIECVALAEIHQQGGPPHTRRRSSIDVRITRSALARLTALVDEFKPDAILVEGIPLFPFLEYLRPLTPNLVLDMHNIESDLGAQIERRTLSSRVFAELTGGDAARIRKLEQQAVGIADRVWVCSESDRQRLLRLYGGVAAVHVVPNGIPRPETIPDELTQPPGKNNGWPIILFVGHLAYPPNVNAVHALAHGVLPLVLADFPAARLILGGRSPTEDILALATRPGIDLVANPEEVSTLYTKAHLTVVPLVHAGGTRIKILEAMAHGLPVVATPLAVDGLELAEGTEVLVADDHRGLADHVRSLCDDSRRSEALRRNARRAVVERFGAAVIAAAVRNAIMPDGIEP